MSASPFAATEPRGGAALRILHIDDDADIREVVEWSLSLDPTFSVRSCSSGADALTTVADWQPDLILCDVMMPIMDGPATLMRLRANSRTAHIPVVFMTARAQTCEVEHFKSLGATGIISKPFDPVTLADSVRGHLRAAGLSALRAGFLGRLRADAATFAAYREDLQDPKNAPEALSQISAFAHALGGAAGIFGYHEISRSAQMLDRAIADRSDGNVEHVEKILDALLASIARAGVSS